MIFVDTSALVAIIADEPAAHDLEDCLQSDRILRFSAMTAWETMAALCHSYKFEPADARTAVKLYADEIGIRMLEVGEREYGLAAEAYRRYGRGRHKAALNMGDCFAYACAKAHRARLLFIGDDFGHTDIANALTG